MGSFVRGFVGSFVKGFVGSFVRGFVRCVGGVYTNQQSLQNKLGKNTDNKHTYICI